MIKSIIYLNIDIEIKEKLNELAKLEHRSLNNYLNTILIEYLKEIDEKQKEK